MPDSNTSGTFYTESLYPLQNRILNVISALCPSLYLTGGTALSRFYFSHRYSDDFDLFANEESLFPEIVEKAIVEIQKIDGVRLKIAETGIGAGYLRIEVSEGEACLIVDFVNDIAFRLGAPVEHDGIRIDTLSNILTNKIAALIGRDELKDVVDVREICRRSRFNWARVLEASSEKEASVDGEYIDYKLSILIAFLKGHPGFLDSINWIIKPDADIFISDLEELRKDILSLSDNSIFSASAAVLEDLS